MSKSVTFEAFMSDMADPACRWIEQRGDPSKFAMDRTTIPVLSNGRIMATADGNVELGEAIDWVMRGLRAKKLRPKRITVLPVDYMVLDYSDAQATTGVVMAEIFEAD